MLSNEAAGDLDPEAKGIELARNIFDKTMHIEQLNVDLALAHVKEEIQQVF